MKHLKQPLEPGSERWNRKFGRYAFGVGASSTRGEARNFNEALIGLRREKKRADAKAELDRRAKVPLTLPRLKWMEQDG